MVTMLDLEMNSGTVKTLRGKLKDAAGAYVNDTGATYRLKVRATPESTSTIIDRQAPGNGSGFQDVSILPEDTSSFTADRLLYYALRVTESGGQPTDLMEGQLLVRVGTGR